MLDIQSLRRDPDAVRRALARRGYDYDHHWFSDHDRRRSELRSRLDELRHERNVRAKAIAQSRHRGEDIAPLLASAGRDDATMAALERELHELDATLERFLLDIPNLPDPDVPTGRDETANVELRRWGTPRTGKVLRDHVELGALHQAMDFASAAEIAQSRFVVLRGHFARLQRALTQFMLDLHTREHGYTEVYVPHLANATSLTGTGQLPKFEADLFRIAHDPSLYLIPTAEVPVTNLVRDKLLVREELPLRFVAHTPCYRSEAGSYGRDVRGMIRQHQFEKVELVQIVPPDRSAEAHEELTSHAERVLQKLELPYRVVLLCTGDMGFAAAKTYDLEVWLPSQDRYREISSCSNFRDFQARRLGTRCRSRSGGPRDYVHTLNGSGLAVGRTLVALLENHQDETGAVHLPQALVSYMDGLDVLRPPR